MNKEVYFDAMLQKGLSNAVELQKKSSTMDGTGLYAESMKIPEFQAAKRSMNMLQRKAGQTDGFVCRSTAGRVVRLIRVYDSDTYTSEPEDLPAQWRFVWSKNPVDALPFVSLATSPYNTGDCRSENDKIYKSKIDTNTWSPSDQPQYWEVVSGE